MRIGLDTSRFTFWQRGTPLHAHHRTEAVLLLALAALAVLAAQLVYRLPVHAMLDIGTPAAQPHLRGFTAPEANDSYTYAFSTQEAEMTLPPAGAGRYRLTIEMSGWRSVGAEPARLTLALPSRHIGTIDVAPEPRSYHLLVSNSASYMRLHWSGSTFAPGTDDTRQLGVAVDMVTFRSVQTYPTQGQVGLLLLMTLLGAALARRLCRPTWAYGATALALVLLTLLLAVQRSWESYLLWLNLGLFALHIVLWLPALGRYFWHHVLPFPEHAFAWIAGLAGVLYLLFAPPFMGFDEHTHFFRAYQVAEGHLLSERQEQQSGGMLPTSLYQFWQELWPDNSIILGKQTIEQVTATANLPLAPEQRQFIDFRGAAVYAPVPYIAHALGIALGQVIAPTPLGVFMLGRLFGLLGAVVLVFWAIRMAPFGKWVFFLIALTPTAVFQMVAFSADGFTNSISLLWCALLLAYAFGPQYSRLKRRDLALLALLSALLTLSKQIYFVLLLLYVLIPVQRLGSYRSYWLTFAGLVAFNLALIGLWSLLVQHYVYVPRLPDNADISPREQVVFIATHPFQFLLVQINTIVSTYDLIKLRQLFGQLGYHMLLSLPLVAGHTLLLTVVALLDGPVQARLTWWHRLVLASTFVAGWLAIHTIAYIGWHAVGSPVIWRVQSRYILPLLPLPFLLLALQKPALVVWKERIVWLLPYYALALSGLSAWQIFHMYYE
jgi:uncharacterized membrane protein